jgi:hypothetical protein
MVMMSAFHYGHHCPHWQIWVKSPNEPFKIRQFQAERPQNASAVVNAAASGLDQKTSPLGCKTIEGTRRCSRIPSTRTRVRVICFHF